jgi:hypothetical protein
MKQTAMQKLISELEYSAKNSTNDLLTTTINYIIDMAKGKLEIEKQQIVYASNSENYLTPDFINRAIFNEVSLGEQYYSETYKNK